MPQDGLQHWKDAMNWWAARFSPQLSDVDHERTAAECTKACSLILAAHWPSSNLRCPWILYVQGLVWFQGSIRGSTPGNACPEVHGDQELA